MNHDSLPKKELPFVFKQYVAWGDMDAFQHVNHTMYLKYFENARVEFFHALGFGKEAIQNIGIVVANMTMEFKKQVRYPSWLKVTIGVLKLQSRFIQFGCSIWDEDQKLVFSAKGNFFWIDFRTGKIVSLPKEYWTKFEPYITHP
ncbi:MAG: acyl-CoA thioesterase [Leptospiraceae bacterium]|nr:acyl-CoA thioesterase [Leptospiraceae bacterium]MDW7977008.1 thioesterase family protein [Leptospiraceae bacterium]